MPASQEAQAHAVERAARIFGLLKAVAARGDVCPTNALLRERFGVGDQSIVSAFHFLESNGMITVERGNARRVVTIRATGQRTAGTVTKMHWSARRMLG